jgi:hypothetical protein
MSPMVARLQGLPEVGKKPLNFDEVDMYNLWSFTKLALESDLRRAGEGRDVLAALDFARYLRNSGILKLLLNNPQPPPLPVDGALIEKLIQDIIWDGGEMLRGGKVKAKYEQSDIVELHRKVNVIGSYLGHLASHIKQTDSYTGVTADLPALPPVASTRQRKSRSKRPSPRVIEGGIK